MNFLNVFLVGVFTMSFIPAEEAFASCPGYKQRQIDRKRDQLTKLEDTHKKELAKCEGYGKPMSAVAECKTNSANLKRQQDIVKMKSDIESSGCTVDVKGGSTSSSIPAKGAVACTRRELSQLGGKRRSLASKEDTYKRELAKCDDLKNRGKDDTRCRSKRSIVTLPGAIEALKKDIKSYESKGCK